MLNSSRSPFRKINTATAKALALHSPRNLKGNSTRKPGDTMTASSNFSTIQARNRNNEPIINFDDKIVHSNQELNSFTALRIDSATKSLNVENNKLTDFKGLPALQHLTEFVFSNNPINTLFAFPSLPKLLTIVCNSTPLSNQEFFRIALILMCPSLHKINGEVVRSSERKVAKEYSPDCVSLVRSGWTVSYPPPTAQEIITIKRTLTQQNRRRAQESSRQMKEMNGTNQRLFTLGVQKQSVLYEKCLNAQLEQIRKQRNELLELLENHEAAYQRDVPIEEDENDDNYSNINNDQIEEEEEDTGSEAAPVENQIDENVNNEEDEDDPAKIEALLNASDNDDIQEGYHPEEEDQ